MRTCRMPIGETDHRNAHERRPVLCGESARSWVSVDATGSVLASYIACDRCANKLTRTGSTLRRGKAA